MKKISKFLLFVVTVISLVFLIFYKLQYDKLYNVLEVLEFYGSPDAADKSARLKESHFQSLLWQPPSWKQTLGSEKVLIYSAFCSKTFDSDDPCPIVKIVAIASKTFDKGYEDTLRPMYGMFYSEPLVVPEGHNFPDQKLDGSIQNMTGYVFSCESKYSSLLPIGVSVIIGDPKENLYTHVEQFPEEIEGVLTKEPSMKACIAPQPHRKDSTQMMTENIFLHRFFGIEVFHIYDSGVTFKFMKNLKELDRPTEIKILPWNIDEEIVSREMLKLLVQTDCHLRESGRGRSIVILEVSQILTPTDGTLQVSLSKNQLEGKLEFNVLKLCPEFQSGQPWDGPNLLTLQQTVFSKRLSQHSVFMSHRLGAHSSVVKVPRNLISVRDYERCPDQLDPVKEDLVKDETVQLIAQAILKEVGKFFPPKKG